MTTIDILLEVFTWIGVGGAVVFALVAVIMWAADGTWLPAEAIVDVEDGDTIVRWYDADGDANSALASPADAALLAGSSEASIWYRHGWRGRMRLQRRPAGVKVIVLAAGGMFALGVVSFVAGWVLYFTRS